MSSIHLAIFMWFSSQCVRHPWDCVSQTSHCKSTFRCRSQVLGSETHPGENDGLHPRPAAPSQWLSTSGKLKQPHSWVREGPSIGHFGGRTLMPTAGLTELPETTLEPKTLLCNLPSFPLSFAKSQGYTVIWQSSQPPLAIRPFFLTGVCPKRIHASLTMSCSLPLRGPRLIQTAGLNKVIFISQFLCILDSLLSIKVMNKACRAIRAGIQLILKQWTRQQLGRDGCLLLGNLLPWPHTPDLSRVLRWLKQSW